MKNFKNVLYLSAVSKIGGAERVLITIAENLCKNNYCPFLITQDEGKLTERLSEIGGEIFILKLPAWRKSKNFIKRYFTVYRIVNIVKKEKIDLIHCGSYRLNPYGLYVSKICKIPFVTNIQDFITKRHIFNFLLHKSQYLIVPSNYIYECFNNLNLKIFKVHNAIDVSKFHLEYKGKIRNEFNINEDDILIGMVAHFVERKGHKFFIEAASIIKKNIKNTKFIIVGDNIWGGPLTKEYLQKFAKEKNIFEDIIFTGERNDIPEILNDLDIFILPSEREPFALVVMEAMTSKVPVIVNKFSGGSCEAIENGKDGLIVDCRNPYELAKSAIDLIKDETLREKLAEEGYKKVKKYFDMPIFIENIKKVYQSILR